MSENVSFRFPSGTFDVSGRRSENMWSRPSVGCIAVAFVEEETKALANPVQVLGTVGSAITGDRRELHYLPEVKEIGCSREIVFFLSFFLRR